MPHDVSLNPELAIIASAASNAAYTAFDTQQWAPAAKPPELKIGSTAYIWIARFSGFDNAAWGSGKEEKYGLT